MGLGPRPARRGDLAGWYAATLDAQAASGLSVAAYAARIGVSMATLYQWRRRLRGRRRGGDAGPRLVEVLVGESAMAGGAGLVVSVCDGRRSIAVPAGFDGDELRRLVTVLESC